MACLGWVCLTPAQTLSQTMGPMTQKIVSSTDRFSVRIYTSNPYPKDMRLRIRAYDQDYKLIKAHISNRDFILPVGGKEDVLVTIPFEGKNEKRVRICAARIPIKQNSKTEILKTKSTNSMKIRTRVCGRYLGVQAQ